MTSAQSRPAPEQDRWELLLEAVVAIAGDLSLDRLLSRVVALASTLIGARYAALGVLESDPGAEGVPVADGDGGTGRRLRTFVYHGISAQEAQVIGPLPEGHGLLGLLIDRPEPVRLHDLTAHPAAYGFPAHHPPMSSFLGVPVRSRDRVFGNLYLTEKAGGTDFTAEDERLVVALADAVGVAVENARLYEDSSRRQRWLAATAALSGELEGIGGGRRAEQLVVDRARTVADCDAAWLVTRSGDRLVVRVQAGDEDVVRSSLDRAWTLLDEVAGDQVPRSVRRLEGTDGDSPALGAAVLVPFPNDGEPAYLGLCWLAEHTPPLHRLDPLLPARFADEAALVLRLARARADRERLAVFEDRDRIGRDLHDLVIQRLFAVGLSLESAGRHTDDPGLAQRLSSAVDDLDATIREIRRSIFALSSHGAGADIQTAMTTLTEQAAATLKLRPHLAFAGPVRTAVPEELHDDLLAVLREALSNASRHGAAQRVEVTLEVADGTVTLTVADDGTGMPDAVVESGLANLRHRASRRGGRLEVASSSDGGTTVRWSVPAA